MVDSLKPLGCLLIVILVIAYPIYWAIHQYWACDPNLISARCAKQVIAAHCPTREIESILKIEYLKDKSGNDSGIAEVSYEFRYMPEAGKTTTANIMRATSGFYFNKDEDNWLTSCGD